MDAKKNNSAAVRGTTAIITQVRTSSTRLPGKVLKTILGKTMLVLFLERLKLIRNADKIIVATTTEPEDGAIVEAVRKFDPGILIYRGSLEDVLDRYYRAAKEFNVRTIVRITSDCPLVDPSASERVIDEFFRSGCDYCCNNFPRRTYPHGLDTEAFSFDALERAWKEAKKKEEREHVTTYIRTHPELFSIEGVTQKRDLGRLRWTVDYPEDFLFVKEIYERLYDKNKSFSMDDVLALLEREPRLGKINQKHST